MCVWKACGRLLPNAKRQHLYFCASKASKLSASAGILRIWKEHEIHLADVAAQVKHVNPQVKLDLDNTPERHVLIAGDWCRELVGHQDAVLGLAAYSGGGGARGGARGWGREGGQCTRAFLRYVLIARECCSPLLLVHEAFSY